MITKTTLLLVFSLVVSAAAGDYEYSMDKVARERRDKGQQTGHCLLHDRDMKRERVPVIRADNDTAPGDPVPWLVRMQQFPHARHVAILRTTDGKHTPNTAQIYVCPDCEAAEAKWQKDHPQ